MEVREPLVAMVTFLAAIALHTAHAQEGDYSEPIKCFYCFGPVHNSSCADPVDPRVDKGKALEVIECDSGICLKWTHMFGKTLYIHRTCSQRLIQFKIMMIDGVCRSERTGKGQLCMCGRNLCNSATNARTDFLGFPLVLAFLSSVWTIKRQILTWS